MYIFLMLAFFIGGVVSCLVVVRKMEDKGFFKQMFSVIGVFITTFLLCGSMITLSDSADISEFAKRNNISEVQAEQLIENYTEAFETEEEVILVDEAIEGLETYAEEHNIELNDVVKSKKAEEKAVAEQKVKEEEKAKEEQKAKEEKEAKEKSEAEEKAKLDLKYEEYLDDLNTYLMLIDVNLVATGELNEYGTCMNYDILLITERGLTPETEYIAGGCIYINESGKVERVSVSSSEYDLTDIVDVVELSLIDWGADGIIKDDDFSSNYVEFELSK